MRSVGNFIAMIYDSLQHAPVTIVYIVGVSNCLSFGQVLPIVILIY